MLTDERRSGDSHWCTINFKRKQLPNKFSVSFELQQCTCIVITILNKSENATPELFVIYIQNYANQESK